MVYPNRVQPHPGNGEPFVVIAGCARKIIQQCEEALNACPDARPAAFSEEQQDALPSYEANDKELDLSALARVAHEAYHRGQPTLAQQRIIGEALVEGPRLLAKYRQLLLEEEEERKRRREILLSSTIFVGLVAIAVVLSYVYFPKWAGTARFENSAVSVIGALVMSSLCALWLIYRNYDLPALRRWAGGLALGLQFAICACLFVPAYLTNRAAALPNQSVRQEVAKEMSHTLNLETQRESERKAQMLATTDRFIELGVNLMKRNAMEKGFNVSDFQRAKTGKKQETTIILARDGAPEVKTEETQIDIKTRVAQKDSFAMTAKVGDLPGEFKILLRAASGSLSFQPATLTTETSLSRFAVGNVLNVSDESFQLKTSDGKEISLTFDLLANPPRPKETVVVAYQPQAGQDSTGHLLTYRGIVVPEKKPKPAQQPTPPALSMKSGRN